MVEPSHAELKYEYDHQRQMFRLDRRLFSATVYPADYGFVLDTLVGDGDPLDALVLVDEPTFPGCLIIARPVAVDRLRDEVGEDAKLLCVPVGEPAWDQVQDLDDLPRSLLDEIAHFFAVYKTLEPGKGTSASGWEDQAAALGALHRDGGLTITIAGSVGANDLDRGVVLAFQELEQLAGDDPLQASANITRTLALGPPGRCRRGSRGRPAAPRALQRSGP